jgi:hypothetical protein
MNRDAQQQQPPSTLQDIKTVFNLFSFAAEVVAFPAMILS